MTQELIMEKHPGGSDMTRHLIELSGLAPDVSSDPEPDRDAPLCQRTVRILDMGAGDGHGVRMLRELGYDAVGIDLAPGKDAKDYILKGNFLNCPFKSQSFDVIISECAFFISGDPSGALAEAARLLKKGGLLLLGDVSFTGEKQHIADLTNAGFSLLELEDITPLWKEYYISCIWNGTADKLCPCIPKGKCSYYLTICERM